MKRKNDYTEPKEEWTLQGVFTVEITYVMGVFLLAFFLGVLGLFYYHDKEIVSAEAYETAVVGTVIARQKDGAKEELLEEFFSERVKGKCIWMAGTKADVTVNQKKINVKASAARRGMNFHIQESGCITEPEKTIRERRKLVKLGEAVVDYVKDSALDSITSEESNEADKKTE